MPCTLLHTYRERHELDFCGCMRCTSRALQRKTVTDIRGNQGGNKNREVEEAEPRHDVLPTPLGASRKCGEKAVYGTRADYDSALSTTLEH